MLKDKFMFYTCILAVICLFFANQSRACTSDKVLLAKIEYNLTLRIYELDYPSYRSSVINNELWNKAVVKAKFITLDNFACKDINLLQVRGY